jgi:signal transduction histidine kinase/CheY-like chemotaxis protein
MPATPGIKRLFQAIPGLFLVFRPDPKFTILVASADLMRATHTDESIFEKPLFEVFPDNPQLENSTATRNLGLSLQKVMETGQANTMPTQRYDLPLPEKLGGGFEERYWNVVSTPAFGPDGKIEYIVNHVEEASAKHNRDAIKILESITEGFFTLDRHWRIDYVNQEAHRILQKNAGELAGKVLWEIYPGLEGTEFEKAYFSAMHDREKSHFTGYYPYLQRWYEITTFPAPEGISVFFQDVTQIKLIEAERENAMRESQRQRKIYETALNSTPDLVVVFDLAGQIIYANEAMSQTLGIESPVGRLWTDPEYVTLMANVEGNPIAEVVETGEPVRGEIVSSTALNPWVKEYIYAPVKNENGEVMAIAGTMRDVTERKGAEESLQRQTESLAQADLAKDEFLATLSHELRNPLAPLRTAIEILRRGKDVNERTARLHATMERQISHMVRLMDDLLEVSRISRGKLTLQLQKVRVSDVVASAVETTASLMTAAGHAFSASLPEQDLWVNADPVRLTQILTNLLNNAAKYTDNGGHISLQVKHVDSSIEISVQDNGIGISSELRPRLFQMFSRGDRHSARNQGGLGIGLALSRRLALMHGGTLEVQSDGIREGSRFTLRLAVALPVEREPEAASMIANTDLARVRVLVIDDNRDAADTLEIMLDTLNADVQVAYGGVQGLEKAKSWNPALVLLDIGMPGMNGFDVAKAIRAQEHVHRPVLVALTGWGQEEDRKRAEAAGFDHHLVKPAGMEALQQVLVRSV